MTPEQEKNLSEIEARLKTARLSVAHSLGFAGYAVEDVPFLLSLVREQEKEIEMWKSNYKEVAQKIRKGIQ